VYFCLSKLLVKNAYIPQLFFLWREVLKWVLPRKHLLNKFITWCDIGFFNVSKVNNLRCESSWIGWALSSQHWNLNKRKSKTFWRCLLKDRCVYGYFLHVYAIKFKKFIVYVFLINYLVKPWILNEAIHQKWSFGSWKLKFGMLDWDCVRIEC